MPARPMLLTGSLEKAPLGPVGPCAAPGCTVSTNKQFVQDRVTLVACCPDHAKKALALSQGR